MADVIPDEPMKLDFADSSGGDVWIGGGEGKPGGELVFRSQTSLPRRIWYLLIAPFTYLLFGRIRL